MRQNSHSVVDPKRRSQREGGRGWGSPHPPNDDATCNINAPLGATTDVLITYHV